MTADNWTACPQCDGEFREDYEIGVFGDEFFIDYRGSCRDCRLSLGYRVEQPALSLPRRTR